jgi:IS6 family transposase
MKRKSRSDHLLSNSFKWKHYEGEIILLNVRWYLKYSLSYRNLEEMMAERGIEVDHTTIMRWVHQYSPEIEKKVRRYLRPTNDSWRMDETYIRVKVRQEAVTEIANQSAPYPFRVSLL